MRDHLPSVGVLPQPNRVNYLGINKLRYDLSSGSRGQTMPDRAFLLCESCNSAFCIGAGFQVLDNFCCDKCFRELAFEWGF